MCAYASFGKCLQNKPMAIRFFRHLRAFFHRQPTNLMASHTPHSNAASSTLTGTTSNPPAPSAKHAYFAAGCFWGVESAFRRHFPLGSGLLNTSVGYIGGETPSPTYRAVCSGVTGHAEALEVLYDAQKLQYQELVEFFFRMHDPCDPGGQGRDRGTQYRSAVFVGSEAEEKVAGEVKRRVQERWYPGKAVATEIVRRGKWWGAEEYHQLYLQKNPAGYECESDLFPYTLEGGMQIEIEIEKEKKKRKEKKKKKKKKKRKKTECGNRSKSLCAESSNCTRYTH